MELPQIGKNCQLENCNALDFLPVKCPFCQSSFCGQHRLPLAHQCNQYKGHDLLQCDDCEQLIKPQEGLSSEEILKKHKESGCKIHLYLARPESKLKCAVDKCNDVDPRVGLVVCNGCGLGYCLKHRHSSTHNCTSMDADQKRKDERKAAAQEIIAQKFTSLPKVTKLKTIPAKKSTGSKLELMKFKSKAKGPASVPVNSRVYLYVQGPEEAQSITHNCYFDKTNSIGRLLDMIADMFKVNNKNNTLQSDDPQRLELYQCPEMNILDKAMKLEKALKDLDTILLERKGVISQ
ncbi:hypothetical protein K501DRAFT_327175 [Backusella circina FSU 941]|nr:hypothetical protein K501DRAFT_327175 [Backusella circina FSU 941]